VVPIIAERPVMGEAPLGISRIRVAQSDLLFSSVGCPVRGTVLKIPSIKAIVMSFIN